MLFTIQLRYYHNSMSYAVLALMLLFALELVAVAVVAAATKRPVQSCKVAAQCAVADWSTRY